MLGEVLELEHGGSLELMAEFHINPELPAVAVQVLFWNMEMLPVLDVMGPELNGFVAQNNESGRVRLTLNMDRLVLNAGMHFVSVIVSSLDFSVHHLRQDNVAAVQMTTKAPSGALSIEQGSWSSAIGEF